MKNLVTAGGSWWIQAAYNRGIWSSIGEGGGYDQNDQKWSSYGWYDMMIMIFILSRKKYDRLYYILQKVKNVKNISKCWYVPRPPEIIDLGLHTIVMALV